MTQFLLENLYYIVNVLTIFVFVLAAWLIWDSGRNQKDHIMEIRSFGFILMAVSLIFNQLSRNGSEILNILGILLMLFGMVSLTVGISLEPINPLPNKKSKKSKKSNKKKSKSKKVNSFLPFFLIIPFLSGLIGYFASYQLWRRFKEGLVKEYQNLLVFLITFSTAQFLSGFFAFRDSSIVDLSNLVSKNGPIELLVIFIQLFAITYLGIWIYNYIRFRIYPLIFSGIMTLVLVISVLSAFMYSIFIFVNTEKEFLSQVEVNANTVDYSINQLRDSTYTAVNLLSINDSVINSLETNDFGELYNTTLEISEAAQDVDYIIVTDKAGVVIVHTDNPEVVGRSISGNLMVNRALAYAETNTTVTQLPQVLAPQLSINSTAPIIGPSGEVLGSIQAAYVLDTAFADRLKNETDLDIIIYSDNNRSATSFVSTDGVSRQINAVEDDEEIINKVLKNGEKYIGKTDIINTNYYSTYIPIKDAQLDVKGMIFAGREEEILTKTLRSSNNLTFMLAAAVTTFSIIPSKFLADYIKNNYRS